MGEWEGQGSWGGGVMLLPHSLLQVSGYVAHRAHCPITRERDGRRVGDSFHLFCFVLHFLFDSLHFLL